MTRSGFSRTYLPMRVRAPGSIGSCERTSGNTRRLVCGTASAFAGRAFRFMRIPRCGAVGAAEYNSAFLSQKANNILHTIGTSRAGAERAPVRHAGSAVTLMRRGNGMMNRFALGIAAAAGFVTAASFATAALAETTIEVHYAFPNNFKQLQ